MNAPRPPDDDSINVDRDLRDLYGKLPRREPGPDLDARIRARGHAAAQGDQRVRGTRRRLHPGWAIAVSVVLASGLLLLTDLPRQAEPPAIDADLAQPPQLQGLAPATPPELPPELQSQRRAAPAAPPAPAPARAAAPHQAPLAASPAPDNSARREQVLSERKLERARAPHDVAATTEQRIERVRTLLQAGRREEAAHALDALRRAWPDYAVPDDLRELLPEAAQSP